MVSFSQQQRQAEPQRRFCANRSTVSATGTSDSDAARFAGSGHGMGRGQAAGGLARPARGAVVLSPACSCLLRYGVFHQAGLKLKSRVLWFSGGGSGCSQPH